MIISVYTIKKESVGQKEPGQFFLQVQSGRTIFSDHVLLSRLKCKSDILISSMIFLRLEMTISKIFEIFLSTEIFRLCNIFRLFICTSSLFSLLNSFSLVVGQF